MTENFKKERDTGMEYINSMMEELMKAVGSEENNMEKVVFN